MATKTQVLQAIGDRTMHCGGCEHTVQFTLKQLPGIHQVNASHKTQHITLTFDPDIVSLERVKQELDWIGYQVTEVVS